MYYNTSIYETGIMACDGGRLYLPYSKSKSVVPRSIVKQNDSENGQIWYDYFNLSEVEGKLFRLMTEGRMEYFSRGYQPDVHLYLIFENDVEHEGFQKFICSYDVEMDIEKVERDFRSYINQDIERANPNRILDLIIASEYYKLWQGHSTYYLNPVPIKC